MTPANKSNLSGDGNVQNLQQIQQQPNVVMGPGAVTRAIESTARSMRVSPSVAGGIAGGANIAACVAVVWYLTRRRRWPVWVRVALGVALASGVSILGKGVDKLTAQPVMQFSPAQQQAQLAAYQQQQRQLAAHQAQEHQRQVLANQRAAAANMGGTAINPLFARPAASARFVDVGETVVAN